MTPGYLAQYLGQALQLRRQAAASVFVAGANSRSYGCCAADCARPAYAGGLCNAHYLRARKGKSLDEPLRARKRLDKCETCGETTNSKGGWGLCAKHYKKERAQVLKDAAIAAFGGACERCGGIFHRRIFDFHHIEAKDADPSYLLTNASPERIAEELSNCRLLCANCHRLEHDDEF